MSMPVNVRSELHGKSLYLTNRDCGSAGYNHWTGHALFSDGSAIQVAFARKADIAGTLASQAALGRPCVISLQRMEGYPFKAKHREAFVLGPRGGAKPVAVEPLEPSAMESLDFKSALEVARAALVPTGPSPEREMPSGGQMGIALVVSSKDIEPGPIHAVDRAEKGLGLAPTHEGDRDKGRSR